MIPTENGSGMVMPVQPMGGYGGGYAMPMMNYGGGLGGLMGGDGWLIILLLLLCGNGMWGGFGGLGGMMWPMMMGGMGGGLGIDYLFPWLNNSQHMSDGFRDQQISTQLSSIGDRVSAGFSDVQLGISGLGRDICQTGNGITAAMNSGFANAETAAAARAMANLQQLFGLQTTMQGGFNANAAATADLKYTVATEACNDRAAISGALNSLLTHIDQKVQGVQDKLCQLELDGFKRQVADEQRENANLRSQLNMATFRESQTAQNALFAQGMSNEVDALYNRLKNCPVNTVPVYGSQPIFTCPNNNPCGYAYGAAA